MSADRKFEGENTLEKRVEATAIDAMVSGRSVLPATDLSIKGSSEKGHRNLVGQVEALLRKNDNYRLGLVVEMQEVYSAQQIGEVEIMTSSLKKIVIYRRDVWERPEWMSEESVPDTLFTYASDVSANPITFHWFGQACWLGPTS